MSPFGLSPMWEMPAPYLTLKFEQTMLLGDLVVVRAVEDADAAGLGQAAVADQPVVCDLDGVVVVLAVVVRLADRRCRRRTTPPLFSSTLLVICVLLTERLQLDAAGARSP